MDKDVEDIIFKQELPISTKVIMCFASIVIISFIIMSFITGWTQFYLKDYIFLSLIIILCFCYFFIQENYIYLTDKSFVIKTFDKIYAKPMYKTHKIPFNEIKKIDYNLTRFGDDILIIDTINKQRFTAIGNNAENIIHTFKQLYPEYNEK